MDERTEIAKGDGLEPGQWWFVEWMRWRILTISCPACGLQTSLKKYAITEEGNVSPVARCAASCGWDGFIHLQDWTGETKETYQIGFKKYGDDDGV